MYLSTNRLVAIAAVAALWFPSPPAAAQQTPPCTACVLVDESGRVLFARAANQPRANASTTKIVTALVVREHAGLDEIVDVSPTAAATGGGGLDLDPGDRYGVEGLLYALLLSSSNEAAVALAEHVAGSEAAFVEMMNEAARDYGARATHFVTAHGLDMPQHYSSARDLARFAGELLDDPILARIVATSRARIEGPSGGELIENRNVLLETYRGATGVKTGYTALAGDVLVASATRDGRSLVAVTMGATSDEVAAVEAAALLDRGWRLLARTQVLSGIRPVATVLFDPAGATEVVAAHPIRGPWLRDRIEITFRPGRSVFPPIAARERVGTIVISSQGRVVATVAGVARHAIPEEPAPWARDLLTTLLRAIGGLVAEAFS